VADSDATKPGRLTLENFLIADRPGLSTPEQFTFHRSIDVVIGLLLIANYMRSTGVFIGEDGALGFSVSGPILTQPYMEAVLKGFFGPESVAPVPGSRGGNKDA
jgi:hypothetical protein